MVLAPQSLDTTTTLCPVAISPVQRRHRTVLFSWLWAIGVSAWELTGGLLQRSQQAEIVGLAAALTSLGLIGASATSRDLDLRTALARLKLGPWMGIGFSLGFGVATLVWLRRVPGYHDIVTSSALPAAGVVAGAGFAALVLAHSFAPKWLVSRTTAADRNLRGRGPVNSGAMSLWILWSIAMVGVMANFLRGSLGYLGDPSAALDTTSSVSAVLSMMVQFGVLATLLSAWRFAVEKRLSALLVMIWMASSGIVIGLFSGQKEAAIVHLVAVVVGFSGHHKLRLLPLAAAAMIILFFITPFIAAYRPFVQTGSGRLSPAEALHTVKFRELLSATPGLSSDASLGGEAVDRWSRIGDVAIIVEQTPSPIEYTPASELIAGPFLGLIPRSIWPGKPVLDAGYEVNQQYYHVSSRIYSSAAVTPYGDLYRHGGIVIVIVGMSMLGLFVRSVDDRASFSSDFDPRLLFLPMLLFTTFVKQEMDFLALTASLVSTVFAAAVAARLVTYPRDSPSALPL